jgi:hypothetical protein
MTEWSNEKNIDFVEDYRSFPCLWMASSAVYKDRMKRSDCLQFLKNKYEMGTTKAALNKIKGFGPTSAGAQGIHVEEEERLED